MALALLWSHDLRKILFLDAAAQVLNIFLTLKWHWQKRTLTLNSSGNVIQPISVFTSLLLFSPPPTTHPPSLAKCVPYLYSHPYPPPQLSVENKSLWRPVTTAGSTTSANCPPFFKDLPFNFRRPPPVSINVDFGRNEPEASLPLPHPLTVQFGLSSLSFQPAAESQTQGRGGQIIFDRCADLIS